MGLNGIPAPRTPCPCETTTTQIGIIDLFAGPGGWEEGLRLLHRDNAIGIEWDEPACNTARAAGHLRVKADITALDPTAFAASHASGVEGLIASPPCQGFSMAGLGEGRGDTPAILAAVEDIHLGADPDTVLAGLRRLAVDHRSALVLEPLRWALALRPRWVAWEQVPAVLPLWQACASVLGAHGYNAWAGLMRAEQFGVPQTRKRAILIARNDALVVVPAPIYSRYNIRDPNKLEHGLPRWVSMADVLGGGPDVSSWAFRGGPMARATHRDLDQPAPTVYSQRTGNMNWILKSTYSTHGNYQKRGFRTLDQPAPTVTTHVDRNKWFAGAGRTSEQTSGQIPRQYEQPAHTITGKGTATWVFRGSNQAHAAKRPLDTPAPTVNFSERVNKVEWIPADAAADPTASGIQVTVVEAALLQTFRADYPWTGTRGDQYRQIGDAIPPLLAAHILHAAGAMCDDSHDQPQDQRQEQQQ